MQTAAQKHDADAFSERVDYPKLRESLKGQYAAQVADKMAETVGPGTVAAFGTMLGTAVTNQMVETLVRPEMVMRAMNEGKVALVPGKAEGTEETEPGAPAEKPDWKYERKGVNRLIGYPADPSKASQPKEERPGFVFDRTGFADWKLTEMRLPLPTKKN